jgi:hypothetical protein
MKKLLLVLTFLIIMSAGFVSAKEGYWLKNSQESNTYFSSLSEGSLSLQSIRDLMKRCGEEVKAGESYS